MAQLLKGVVKMETKSKAIKKVSKKENKSTKNYMIKKANGNVIYRKALTANEIKTYESKGCKVEVK